MSSVSSVVSPCFSAALASVAKSSAMPARCSGLTLRAMVMAKAPKALTRAFMVSALAGNCGLLIVFAFKSVFCVLALLRRAGGYPFFPPPFKSAWLYLLLSPP